MKLTKTDIQAIKAADSFVVRLTPNTSVIECIKRVHVRKSGPFEAQREELRYLITFEDAAVNAFFYVSFANGAVDALRLILRDGDDVTLRTFDNTNGYATDAGLHNDELRVSVSRNGKTLIDGLVLDHSLCPDNAARAVRTERYTLTA